MLSIDKISFKGIDAVVYNIKYITLKSLNHVNTDSKNPPYLIFDNVDGCTEESNRGKNRQKQRSIKKVTKTLGSN